jgi:hypothetical protein
MEKNNIFTDIRNVKITATNWQSDYMSPQPYSLKELKKVISEALAATKGLDSLDMTTEQKEHYKRNRVVLKKLLAQLGTGNFSNWILRQGKWFILCSYILYCIGIFLLKENNMIAMEPNNSHIINNVLCRLIASGYIVASILWIIVNRTQMSKDDIRPINNAPSLDTSFFLGTTIYGSSFVFVVFASIPICWIARYSVDNVGSSYSFYGKKRLRTWQIVYNVIFLSPVVFAIQFMVYHIIHNAYK